MKLIIDCLCGADILKVEKTWEDESKNEYEIWFCMYKSGQMPLWDRVKATWHYFWHGEFFYNDISMSKNQMEELIAFLVKAKEDKVTIA